jgi:outer membrane receptor protein involved in Fe transport
MICIRVARLWHGLRVVGLGAALSPFAAAVAAAVAVAAEAPATDDSQALANEAAMLSPAASARSVLQAANVFRYAKLPPGQDVERQDMGPGGARSAITGDTAEPTPTPRSALSVGPSGLGAGSTGSPEAGAILADAPGNEMVRAQRRSPVSFDPRIRGYRTGQIYGQADGALWRPAREDLDTMLSKLSPSLITGIHVVSGPYGVQYGPGFAFIDVTTAETPRHDCGFEAHNTFGLNYRTNGAQWYGYDMVDGGNSDWGFRVGYGNRNGADYESGSGEDIPSSYLNQDFLAQFGFNINPFQKFEVRFQHLDQTNTEYFGKFFDLDVLTSDSVNFRLVDDNPVGPWTKAVVEGWYNETRYRGDTDKSGKTSTMDRVERALERRLTTISIGAGTPPIPPGTPVPAGSLGDITFRGDTFGDLESTGGRAAVTFGEPDDANLTLGADFRYLSQRIEERFTTATDDAANTPVPVLGGNNGLDQFFTLQPRSWMVDPGTYAELAIPLRSYWKATIGARADWVRTDVDDVLRPNTSLPGAVLVTNPDLRRDDSLYAFYLTNDVQLDENWTVDAGFGHAQRPPTLTERYADGVFLGIFQNGFSRVIGNSFLKPERVWQVDLGLRGDYDYVHGGLRGFYSWILDYNTYEIIAVNDPMGAQLVRGITTKSATMAGFELDGSVDLTSLWTLFGSLAYVDGRDRDLDVPLTAISPLEGRIGVRLHDPTEDNRWSIEFFGRIVDDQHRLAALRNAGGVLPVESATPGFTVWHLRGSVQANRNLRLTGGVENVFDRNYLEHLDLRLPAQPADGLAALNLFAPGITPYVGMEWTY